MDLVRLCRGCMGTTFLMPIFQGKGDMPDKFYESTSIKISQGDGFPAFLCAACMRNVVQAHNFKAKCLQTDTELKLKIADLNATYLPNDIAQDLDLDFDSVVKCKPGDTDKLSFLINSLNESVDSTRVNDLDDDDMNNDDDGIAGNSSDDDFIVKQDPEILPPKPVKKIEKKRKRNKEDLLTCTICSKSVLTHLMTSHMKHEHKKIVTACKVCHKIFYNDFNRKQHERSHSEEERLKCDLCNETFSGEHLLDIHLRMCKRKNAAPKKPSKPRVVHTTAVMRNKIMCSECDKGFESKEIFNMHVEAVHNNDIKPDTVGFMCADCGQVLPTKHAMRVHDSYHRRHKNRAEGIFVCRICGKCCDSNATLIRHIRVHTNERPFQCPSCPKCFKTPTHLKGHQLVHTKDKNFFCSECDKAFALKGNLVAHMRIHTGERPYVCHICKKSYIHPNTLRKHTRDMHSDQHISQY